jgi:ribosome maturation factor RimP
MDRPLKKLADFERFAGSLVNVRLKLPLHLSANDTAGRKNFTGTLQAVNTDAPEGEQLSMVFEHEGAEQVLAFGLSDVDKARLVPVYNFKGKQK